MLRRIITVLVFSCLYNSMAFAQKADELGGEEKVISVFIPNAFTPNFDGLNDSFKVVADKPVDYFELVILNRSGEEVFYSRDISRAWNGSVDNNQYFSSPSVFVYFLKLRAEGEVITRTYSGHVVMIR